MSSSDVHLTHLEDLTFLEPQKCEGARKALEALSYSATYRPITTKWDGNPSIVFGIHPVKNMFFIASKNAYFAKTDARVCYSQEDVVRLYSAHATTMLRMSRAFERLSNLNYDPNVVLQGDLMYTFEELKLEHCTSLGGDNYVTFQPNMILYAVPVDSTTALEILRSKIGIFIHTSYRDGSKKGIPWNWNRSYSSRPDVYFRNVSLPNMQASNTHEWRKQYSAEICRLQEVLYSLRDFIPMLDSKWSSVLLRWSSELARQGKYFVSASYTGMLELLVEFLQTEFIKEGDKIKSPESRRKKLAEYVEMDRLLVNCADDFYRLFNFIGGIFHLKLELMKLYSDQSEIVALPQHEGYVLEDGGERYKLVNRNVFTHVLFEKIARDSKCDV